MKQGGVGKEVKHAVKEPGCVIKQHDIFVCAPVYLRVCAHKPKSNDALSIETGRKMTDTINFPRSPGASKLSSAALCTDRQRERERDTHTHTHTHTQRKD